MNGIKINTSKSYVASELEPKVSIITVCFNSANTIEKTIESVIIQDYPNMEYIIIDGGSTDGTIDLIERYEQYISHWLSEKDNGISDAFNKGISKASGDLVGIINSDDWYAPEAIKHVVEAFKSNPEIGFVFGDLIISDTEGQPLYSQTGDPYYQRMIAFDMPSIPHPTVFVRKEIYERFGGFSTDYKTAMDYEFLLKLWKNGVAGLYLPVILAYMRLNGESDVNYTRGYHEVMRISVHYGYNYYFAFFRFCFKCCKTFTKKVLQRIGFSSSVKLYRKYFSNRYKY
ncbi:hypothetical protein SCACP_32080 [Sporomusa carbonis]|uniref:glycosyltransferase family 2 protein n=1 Tax=Sporomusa carbonis TaxID=3076075 RepID=UPI003A631C27